MTERLPAWLRRRIWVVLVPLGLGFYQLIAFRDQLDYLEWAVSFWLAIMLQSVLFAATERRSNRSLSAIIWSTAVLVLAGLLSLTPEVFDGLNTWLATEVFLAGRPVLARFYWLLTLLVLHLAIGYPGGVILRHLPRWGDVEALSLTGRMGLLILGINSLVAAALFIVLWTGGGGPEVSTIPQIALELVLGAALLYLVWRNSAGWPAQRQALLALFALLVAAQLVSTIGRELPTISGLVSLIKITLRVAGICLSVTSVALLSAAGVRFARQHLPTLERLRQAGLLDWRSALFLLGAALVLLMTTLTLIGQGTLSLDAFWTVVGLFAAATVVLYWEPSGRWQRDPGPLFIIASLAILASIPTTLLALLARIFPASVIFGTFFSVALAVVLVNLLILLLPWFRSQLAAGPGDLRDRLNPWFAAAVFIAYSVASGYLVNSVFAARLNFKANFVSAAIGICALLYLLYPRARAVRNPVWFGASFVLSVVGTMGVAGAFLWDAYLRASLGSSYRIGLFVVLFLGFQMMVVLGLYTVLGLRSLFTGLLAGLMLMAVFFILLTVPWSLGESGTAAALFWTGAFLGGWLLSRSLGSRSVSWGWYFGSLAGLLVICLLLLPLLFRPSALVSYFVNLPIWINLQVDPLARLQAVMVGQPLQWQYLLGTVGLYLLVLLASAFLFYHLVRNGEILFSLSPRPKAQAVAVAGLALGAFLASAGSYISSEIISLHRLAAGIWGEVSLPVDFDGPLGQMFRDGNRNIWISTAEGELAQFTRLTGAQDQPAPGDQAAAAGDSRGWMTASGVDSASPSGRFIKLYADDRGRTWLLGTAGMTLLGRDSGSVLVRFGPADFGLGNQTVFTDIFQDGRGIYWIGTETGLIRAVLSEGDLIKLVDWQVYPGLSRRVLRIGEDSLGRFYFRTDARLWYDPIPAAWKAIQINGPNPDFTIDLPLEHLEAGANVNLELSVDRNLGPGAGGVVEASIDGGAAWKKLCPQQTEELDELIALTCVFSGENDLQETFRYDLSEFAGAPVRLRLRYDSSGEDGGNLIILNLRLASGASSWQVLLPVETLTLRSLEWSGEIFSWQSADGATYYVEAGRGQVYRMADQNLEPVSLGGLDLVGVLQTVFQDGAGQVWVGQAGQDLLFSGEGTQFVPVPGLTSVSAAAEQDANPRYWFAGQHDPDDDPASDLQFVVASLSVAEQPLIQSYFNRENDGLPVGNVLQMHFDEVGDLWILVRDNTFIPNSLLGWFVLPALMLILLSAAEYTGQPRTKAARLEKKLHRRAEDLVEELIQVLKTDPDAGLVMVELASRVRRDQLSRMVRLLASLSPSDPLPDAQELAALAEAFGQVDLQYAPAMSIYYHVLADALAVNSVRNIAAWRAQVLRTEEPGPPMLASDRYDPVPLPAFVAERTLDAIETLSQTADNLDRYIKIDSSNDKLIALADALASSENAQRTAAQAALPEHRILQVIALDWREIIRQELHNYSGQAELRLELRTPQMRRASQATLALRLENAGRAAAENIRVELLGENGYAVLGEAIVRVERLASGGATPVEFQIRPGSQSSVRMACRISWDDRAGRDHGNEFADEIRFYERKEEFRRIPNPYKPGPPLKTENMFMGREDVFRFISENLTGVVQDRTIVLHGQRRTGKTSILYQLLGGRLGPALIPVFIDMQEMALLKNTAEFFGELAYKIVRSGQKQGLEMEEPALDGFSGSPIRLFIRFLVELDEMLVDQRFLILFDEFELIEQQIREGRLDEGLLGYFRSLMQHRSSLLFIFTGTHRLEEMSHDYWSIFFNIAIYRRISFLSEADTARLVREPVEGALDVDALAVEKIYDLTRGHPYFVQLVCWALVRHCNAQERNYATINDINDAVEEILITGRANFAYIWQQAAMRDRLALAGLAQTSRPGQTWARPGEILETIRRAGGMIEPAELIRVLDSLVAGEVLQSSATDAKYSFQIELLRQWVATQPLSALIERIESSVEKGSP